MWYYIPYVIAVKYLKITVEEIALVAGPLDRILQDLTFTPIFESKAYAFLFCLLMTVVGGAMDFFANLDLKKIEES